MNTLDLFCGTKSFSKVAQSLGYETYTLDILSKFNPTYCCDLMDWNYKDLPKGFFKIIWASPNCKDYSKMNFLRKKPKDLTYSNNLIKKVIEIIEYFEPSYWYIENPQTGTLKDQDFMDFIPFTDVDYCKYGYTYRKRTRVWNNNLNWIPTELCCKNHYCKTREVLGKHNMKWVTRGGGSNKWEQKISIPEKLIEQIINASI